MMNVLGWSLYKYKGPKRHITENLERFGEPTVEHYDRKGSFMTRLCGVGNSFDHHEPANHVITFKSGEKTVTIGLCHEHAQHLANDLIQGAWFDTARQMNRLGLQGAGEGI